MVGNHLLLYKKRRTAIYQQFFLPFLFLFLYNFNLSSLSFTLKELLVSL